MAARVAARMAACVALGALALAAQAPAAAAPAAIVQVNARHPGARIPRDYAGFSNEVSTAGMGLPQPSAQAEGTVQLPAGVPAGAQLVYALGRPGAPNRGFFRFMRNLGPGVLRLGGNSQDNTCWKPATAPHPDWCKGAITPGLLRLYARAAQASGWRLIIGLNLKQNSPRWARSEVAGGIAKTIPAASIIGLELGNEPSLFVRTPARPKNYSPADYARDALGYIRALRADPQTRGYSFAGPANCCQWNNPASLNQILSRIGPDLKLVTVHNYPTTTCGRRNVTAQELLSPRRMASFDRLSRALAATARRHHLPLALAETNSASCGGMAGVSDAFASAAWGLDYMFHTARDGYTLINFHFSYRAGGSAYNPIVTFGWKQGGRERYRNLAQPLYYAMYMFSRYAEGEHFLPARITTPHHIAAYATSACGACAIHVFVINEDAAASGRVVVHVNGRHGGAARLLALGAPSLDSPAGSVRFGGRQFDSAGRIAAPRTRPIAPARQGDYAFTLPRAAAVVLTIRR